jgi:Holliday junction resolvase RusA-like endonuclease
MQQKAEKAGPVATGTDLQNSVLANCSENSLVPRELQVRRLTRRCALTAAMAAIVAPLAVLRAIFPVPASWSERKRQQAITGDIKPGKKPDLDNIAKAWNDALNGVAYRDDSLICQMTLDKRYGPQPLVVVTIKPMVTA